MQVRKHKQLLCLALALALSLFSAAPHVFAASTQSEMLEDALSLVGKVRYVWGGGHVGTAEIKGVSPLWEPFNALYLQDGVPSEATIGTSTQWCPFHSSKTCLENDPGCYSVERLINERADLYGLSEEDFSIFSTVDFSDRSEYKRLHRFDGLDCSGFMSWVVYQALGTYQESMEYMELSPFCTMVSRYDLKPGDIVEFDAHTYMLVGEVQPGCWIHVESTPGVLRLGVTWWGNGKWAIDEAYQIILQYYAENDLTVTDPMRVFNLDALPENGNEGLSIGRVNGIQMDISDDSAYSVLGLR